MIKIAFLGDFCAQTPQNISFGNMLNDLLSSCDIKVCNFEAPLKNEGCKIMKSGPSISQPVESISFLQRIGFNAVLLANNHMMDYGSKGCRETINEFGDTITVGAGIAEEAYRIKSLNVKGKNIGIMSACQHEFGTVDDLFSSKKVGVAWINSHVVQETIRQEREKYDFLVVCPHAGVEETYAPLPEWRKVYKCLIDFGADAVIASHPHTPQGWETYKGKKIYYSLGNFYFDIGNPSKHKYANKSLCVICTIDANRVEYITYIIENKNDLIEICQENEITEHVRYLNTLLRDEKEYEEYIHELCIKLNKTYRYGLLRGVCGTSFKVGFKLFVKLLGGMVLNQYDEMYLLNALQCESHRWVIERFIKEKYNLLD